MVVNRKQNVSEQWFERYLRETGHTWDGPDPDLGIGRRPDYLISKAGASPSSR